MNRRSICAAHPQHGNDPVSHLSTCRDVWIENGDGFTLLLDLVDQVKDIARIEPQPIQSAPADDEQAQ